MTETKGQISQDWLFLRGSIKAKEDTICKGAVSYMRNTRTRMTALRYTDEGEPEEKEMSL